jgi:hypothetical protein
MSFAGWWYNPKTNEGKHVAEHWTEVQYSPEVFGLTAGEVEKMIGGQKYNPGDTSQESVRGKLIIAAMKNGWVRVRGWKGQYHVQLFGNAASKLPKVMKFLKQAGVGPYTPILFSDLATGYQQNFAEGMDDMKKAIKAGSIPDVSSKTEVGSEAGAMTGDKKETGIPHTLSDKQKRQIMRQRIGQKAGIQDPSPADNRLEERVNLWSALTSLLGGPS